MPPPAESAVGLVVADGLVATVAHAVAGEEEITVTTPDGRTLPGAVAAIDTDARRRRLPRRRARSTARSADGPIPTPSRSRSSRPTRTPCRRSPSACGAPVTIRTSDIYREGEHLRPGFELDAPVAAGDSGGGLVAQDGSLLGGGVGDQPRT